MKLILVAVVPDGKAILVWESARQDNDGHAVATQRYNSDGSKWGDEFVVNTTTALAKVNPRLPLLITTPLSFSSVVKTGTVASLGCMHNVMTMLVIQLVVNFESTKKQTPIKTLPMPPTTAMAT